MNVFNPFLSKKLLQRVFLLFAMFVFALPLAQSKEAPLSTDEKKVLKKLRITPATQWIEAHDFAGKMMDAKTVNLQDYRGRFVLLNFWATWCSPCLKEMPDLENAYNEMGQEKLVVLAVGMGESVEKIKAFFNKYGFTFPLLADNRMKITKLYGVRNIPVTYLIDPDGVVLGRALGVRDWASPDLLAFIDSRLK
ncbi:MAG: TlpA disulfide reductase family protein [SAR324 cluster bacterium]|jgi:peroxiredoxin|nr:TlpA disulfide reductase family protein [SAR324 cluster bacterium]